MVRMHLQMVHPNPGPRDKTEAGVKATLEQKYTKRGEKRERNTKSSREKEDIIRSRTGLRGYQLLEAAWNKPWTVVCFMTIIQFLRDWNTS